MDNQTCVRAGFAHMYGYLGRLPKRVVGDTNKEVIRVETALSFRLSVFYHTFCQCECVTMVKGCSAET